PRSGRTSHRPALVALGIAHLLNYQLRGSMFFRVAAAPLAAAPGTPSGAREAPGADVRARCPGWGVRVLYCSTGPT
ncbi:hypothetical protein ABZ726_27590, partial [Streptomyces hundungensis]